MWGALTHYFWADIIAWLCLACYTTGFAFQIEKNYRVQSTQGLSDLYLFFYFLAYITFFYYAYCCWLPAPYRMLVPVEAGLVTLMILQRFYYHPCKLSDRFTLAILGACALNIIFLPLAITWPYETGYYLGWVAFVCFTVNQLPQMVKIYRNKSVEGFSFTCVTIISFAMALELIVALLRSLPTPTILLGVRGILFYFIYLNAFWRYGEKNDMIPIMEAITAEPEEAHIADERMFKPADRAHVRNNQKR